MKPSATQVKFNSYCEDDEHSLATSLSTNSLAHKMKRVVLTSILDFTLYFRVVLLLDQASTLG